MNEDDLFKNKPLDKVSNYIFYSILKRTNQLSLATTDSEFFGSGFIYSNLCEHPELANNNPTKPYFDKVDTIEKQAKKKLKRKDAREKSNH